MFPPHSPPPPPHTHMSMCTCVHCEHCVVTADSKVPGHVLYILGPRAGGALTSHGWTPPCMTWAAEATCCRQGVCVEWGQRSSAEATCCR